MPLANSKLQSGVPAVESSMRSALERAAHHARAYLATLDTGAVVTTVSRQELLSRLDVSLTRDGVAADVLVDGIGALPGVEILSRPTINQGLVRFLAQHPGAAPEDHDARTDEVIARINRSGGPCSAV